MPADEFYSFVGNRLSAYCRRCHHWNKHHYEERVRAGWVPIAAARPVYDELRRRIGTAEMARRMGVARNTIIPRVVAANLMVRIWTYEAAVRVLREARAKGEDDHDTRLARSRTLTQEGRILGGRRRWEIYRERQAKARKLLAKRSFHFVKKLCLQFIAERNAPVSSAPDPAWWVFTGMEWIPRYGEEELGADF